MIKSIDLKPLTDEIVAQMGVTGHDLWLIRIDSVVYGPFETESLKHYVLDNEDLFEQAEASRADETEWKPFWTHTKFQRRRPQVLQGQVHEGPFWIMDYGLKAGPFSFKEIDKKLEMDLLGMTDLISVDEGQNWIKIFEIEGFDRRAHSPDDLPIAPYESSFHKAKLLLVEKLESSQENVVDEFAQMCFEGLKSAKVIPFKFDEIPVNHQHQTPVSEALRWALPAAMAVVLTVGTIGYIFSTESDEQLALVDKTQISDIKIKPKKVAKTVAPKPQIPSPQLNSNRTPASVGYSQKLAEPARQDDSPSRYPTHVETHEEYSQEPYYQERDPLDAPVTDFEKPVEEHSLVENRSPQEEPIQDQSLDATMNGLDPQAELLNQPMVLDESSDF